MAESNWVELGRVERAHGIRGEIRVRLHNPSSSTLEDCPAVRLAGLGAEPRPVRLERVRPVPGGAVIAKLEGVDDRSKAELLRGATVEAERSRLPELEPSEFYVRDLVGAEVFGPSGRLGTVEGVESYPSTDALVIRRDAVGDRVEVPLVDDFVARVDVQSRKVFLLEDALAFFEL